MSAKLPDPQRLKAVKELFAWPRPYENPPQGDRLFVDAMRDITAWHKRQNPFYGRLAADFDEGSLESVRDCAEVPFVPADFFKHHELLSVPRDDIALHVTSSGTSGQKSQMFYDGWSVHCTFTTLDRVAEHLGWVTELPASYLLFTYESDPDNKLGTAYTDYYMTRYAPAEEIFAALRKTSADGSSHEFDAFGTIETLKRFATRGLPVRIFGFPSFLWFTLERMRALNLDPLRLPEGSLVVTGGGWKGYADKAVPKAEVIRRTEEQLGIPPEKFSDFYGTVEHGMPYLDCPHHRLHVPIYTRAFVRHPKTLEVRDYGEPGILQFLAPYNTSSPAHSLLTGDWVTLNRAEECGCELATPYLEIHGRAGRAKNRSCAIAASELLRGKS